MSDHERQQNALNRFYKNFLGQQILEHLPPKQPPAAVMTDEHRARTLDQLWNEFAPSSQQQHHDDKALRDDTFWREFKRGAQDRSKRLQTANLNRVTRRRSRAAQTSSNTTDFMNILLAGARKKAEATQMAKAKQKTHSETKLPQSALRRSSRPKTNVSHSNITQVHHIEPILDEYHDYYGDGHQAVRNRQQYQAERQQFWQLYNQDKTYPNRLCNGRIYDTNKCSNSYPCYADAENACYDLEGLTFVFPYGHKYIDNE